MKVVNNLTAVAVIPNMGTCERIEKKPFVHGARGRRWII